MGRTATSDRERAGRSSLATVPVLPHPPGPPARPGPTGPITAVPGATLPPLEEPVELLGHLRTVSRDEPSAARATAPSLLVGHAFEAWSAVLVAAGIRQEILNAAFQSLRREIWLWVEGERRWDQLNGQLAGRVSRRAALAGDEVPSGALPHPERA